MAGGHASEERGLTQAETVVSGRFQTSWGKGLVTVCQGRLAGVELPPVLGEESTEVYDVAAEGDQALLSKWVNELEAYFRGERLSWTAEEVGLDGQAMTPFMMSVYSSLLTVPAGITVSYGVLAGMAGFPRAARAVGNAMANNHVPVVIPCHRVVRSDGSLGRYGSDPMWKKRLLAHEEQYALKGAVSR